MARMDSKSKAAWKLAIQETSSSWIVVGINGALATKSARLEGVAGLVDWYLHGQVSQLLKRNLIDQDEYCLIPGDQNRRRQNFLFLQIGPESDAKSFALKVKKLKIQSLCVAESSFPEDFLVKLKQTFKKENIEWKQLEPSKE